MNNLPRSLEFAIIMETRKRYIKFKGVFPPVFHFDGQFGWYAQEVYMHNFGKADGHYQVSNLKSEEYGLSFSVRKID